MNSVDFFESSLHSRREAQQMIISYEEIGIRKPQCKDCRSFDKPLFGGYCVDCFKRTRFAKALEEYKKGLTLQSIGEEMGLTKERVRQIIMKAVKIQCEMENGYVSVTTAWERVKKQHKKHTFSTQNWFKHFRINHDEVISTAKTYHDVNQFMDKFDVPASAKAAMKLYFPDIFASIKPQWSKGDLTRAREAQKNMDPIELSKMKAKAGRQGGTMRAKRLSSERRTEIARKAGLARAQKERKKDENF